MTVPYILYILRFSGVHALRATKRGGYPEAMGGPPWGPPTDWVLVWICDANRRITIHMGRKTLKGVPYGAYPMDWSPESNGGYLGVGVSAGMGRHPWGSS